MRLLAPIVAFSVLALGPSPTLPAASLAPWQAYSITGKLIDPANLPIPGATVELRQGDAVRQRTVSDPQGDWRFDGVAPGDYRVRMTLAGFVTTEVAVSVRTESPQPLLTMLKVGAGGEVVLVEPGPVAGAKIEGNRTLPSAPPPPAMPAPAGRAFGGTAVAGAGTAGQIHSRDLYEFRRPDTADYADIDENRFRRATEHPRSTFRPTSTPLRTRTSGAFSTKGTCLRSTPCASRNWSTTSSTSTQPHEAMRPLP
jgi:hypothetical protein